MHDELRTCVDCTLDFTITEGEIEFYSSKDMQLPKRCKDCRQKRKALKMGGGGNFRNKAPIKSRVTLEHKKDDLDTL